MRGSLSGKSCGRNRERALGASKTSLAVGEALLLSQIRPHFPSVATRGQLPRCSCGPGGLTFPAVACGAAETASLGQESFGRPPPHPCPGWGGAGGGHSGGPAVLGGAGLDPVSSQMGSFPGCGLWFLAENARLPASAPLIAAAPPHRIQPRGLGAKVNSGVELGQPCLSRPPPTSYLSRPSPCPVSPTFHILHLQAPPHSASPGLPSPILHLQPPTPIYPAFIPPTFLTRCCRFSRLLFAWVQKWSPEDLSMSSSHVF